MFRLFEGPIALYHRGYVRGVFTTSSLYHYPGHCSSSPTVTDVFSHLNTKFQQIGRDDDSINNSDWYYFPFGDNDSNRYQMQQIFVQGSFEGCIVQVYWYYASAQWNLYRQVLTVDTVIDPTTAAQKVMWHTQKAVSLVKNDQSLIPCDHETLYYHPYQRFFFYYWKYQKIVILDRGFTTATGDACTTTVTPSTVNTWTFTVSSMSYLTEPAFYGGFCYIGAQHSSNGYSYLYRWDATMNTAGTTFSSSWTNIKTSAYTSYYRNIYGMQDVGLFWTYYNKVGYYLTKINSATGSDTSTTTMESTKTWKIFQARFNNVEDVRPVYLVASDNKAKIYKATNVLTDHFTDSANKYNFFEYPVDFGRYYAMELRPGTCAQENGGSEDYDKLHVNVLSLRDKAHVLCIDDSEDIYCGNSKWEEYNLEACDDGDNANGDGCSSTCTVEARWVCVNTVNATSVCTYTACGNSYIDSGEQCDDGNTTPGDGCSATCQIEDCYFCSGTGASSCTLQCENGVSNTNTYFGGSPKKEECDEGAGSDALGCLDCCTKIQTKYKCTFGSECTL